MQAAAKADQSHAVSRTVLFVFICLPPYYDDLCRTTEIYSLCCSADLQPIVQQSTTIGGVLRLVQLSTASLLVSTIVILMELCANAQGWSCREPCELETGNAGESAGLVAVGCPVAALAQDGLRRPSAWDCSAPVSDWSVRFGAQKT